MGDRGRCQPLDGSPGLLVGFSASCQSIYKPGQRQRSRTDSYKQSMTMLCKQAENPSQWLPKIPREAKSQTNFAEVRS